MNESPYLIKILEAVEEIRNDMSEVKQDISQLKQDMTLLKEDVRKVLKFVSVDNADFKVNHHELH